MIFSSICSRASILQNIIKYAILNFRSAVEYIIVSRYKLAVLCSRCDTDDMNWALKKTIVIHTHRTVCLLQICLHFASNTSPNTSSKIQLINWTCLWNLLTFLLVFTYRIKTIDFPTSRCPVHRQIFHFSSQLL